MNFDIQVDGYGVGDRLLEGVMFNVKVEVNSLTDIKVNHIEVVPEAASYFEQLNKQMWYDQIIDSVEDNPWSVWEEITEEEFARVVETYGDPRSDNPQPGVTVQWAAE